MKTCAECSDWCGRCYKRIKGKVASSQSCQQFTEKAPSQYLVYAP